MIEKEFTLIFSLQDPQEDPGVYVSDLLAHGCDDALLGIGKKGSIALNFIREMDEQEVDDEISQLVDLVEAVIPGSHCVQKKIGVDEDFLCNDV